MSGCTGGSFENPLSLLLCNEVTTCGGGTGGIGGWTLRPAANNDGKVPDGRIYQINISFYYSFLINCQKFYIYNNICLYMTCR